MRKAVSKVVKQAIPYTLPSMIQPPAYQLKQITKQQQRQICDVTLLCCKGGEKHSQADSNASWKGGSLQIPECPSIVSITSKLWDLEMLHRRAGMTIL